LNGAARSDVEAAGRSNLISGDSAKIPAVRATKKEDFFARLVPTAISGFDPSRVRDVTKCADSLGQE
jgi:hypothetical protein